MSAGDASIDAVLVDRRKRVCDGVWLVTIPLVVTVVALPWTFRALDISLTTVVGGAIVFAAVYLMLGRLTRSVSSARTQAVFTAVLQVFGILTLAVVWRFAGGLQNPMLLGAFVLPVLIGALPGFRWLPYLSAAASTVSVTLVALMDSPDLRWSAVQSGLPIASLVAIMDKHQIAGIQPFSAYLQPVEAEAVILIAFIGVMVASANAVDVIASALRDGEERLSAAANLSRQRSDAAFEVLQASPWPAVLIAESTGVIADASRAFSERFWVRPEEVVEGKLTDVLTFSYPDVIESLIRAADGEPKIAEHVIEGERRFSEVSARRVSVGGLQFVYVSLIDVTENLFEKLALDNMAIATIVLDDQERILSLSGRPTRDLIRFAPIGTRAEEAFKTSSPSFAWWRLGVQRSRDLRLELNSQTFHAACAVISATGQTEAFTLISLTPIEGSTS